MAATLNTTETRTVTYAMLVIFTVPTGAAAQMQDTQVMRDEAQSWLESLDATVHGVNIRKAD
ncbi:MAG: hypothetical protein AB7I36_20380 [Rhodospirillaceae bacterium]